MFILLYIDSVGCCYSSMLANDVIWRNNKKQKKKPNKFSVHTSYGLHCRCVSSRICKANTIILFCFIFIQSEEKIISIEHRHDSLHFSFAHFTFISLKLSADNIFCFVAVRWCDYYPKRQPSVFWEMNKKKTVNRK